MSKSELEEAFKDELFISNVCFSYDHSYGLQSEERQAEISFQCKEWMRAISNNWEYRILKLNPMDKLKHTAKTETPYYLHGGML